MARSRQPSGGVRASGVAPELRFWCDLDSRREGHLWAQVHEADRSERLKVGALVVAGNDDYNEKARVVGILEQPGWCLVIISLVSG